MGRLAVLLIGCMLGIASFSMLGGCQENGVVEWWISIPSSDERAFLRNAGDFNRYHPGQVILVRNLPIEKMHSEFQKQVAKGHPPTFMTLSHEQMQAFPANSFAPWCSNLAPSIRQAIFNALWDHPLGSENAWCLPLWMEESYTATNTAMTEAGGLTAVPTVLGEIAKGAKAFRSKTGKYLWLPALGDPDYAMALLDLQGLALVNTKLEPTFQQGGGPEALGWWVKQFADGVFPMQCLDLTTPQAIARFQAGEVALACGRPEDILSLHDTSTFKLKKLGAARDVSGSSDRVRSLVFGLYHPKGAPLGMAAQNLAAFLCQTQAQREIANAVNSLPASAQAYEAHGMGTPAGGAVLLNFNQIGIGYATKTTTTVGGLRQRPLIAKAVRAAFIAAIRDKKDPGLALNEAAAAYRQDVAKMGEANQP